MCENCLFIVCEEVGCFNVGECWLQGYVIMMIMGEICICGCIFCNVVIGKFNVLDVFELGCVVYVVQKLGLNYVVIILVDRDDLDDGGVEYFVQIICVICYCLFLLIIEVLMFDFLKLKFGVLEIVVEVWLDVFNYNLEIVLYFYLIVWFGVCYFYLLWLLQKVKELDLVMFIKLGIMVGLGEDCGLVLQVMDDMCVVDIDFMMIGQYLQLMLKYYWVDRFVILEEFVGYEKLVYGKGFLMVLVMLLIWLFYYVGDDFV